MIIQSRPRKPVRYTKQPIDERETSVQLDMVRALEKAGFFVTQNREKYIGRGPKSTPGIPDLVIVRRGIVAWIEVKTTRPGSKPSKEQLAWHNVCREHGGLVYVARTLEDIQEIIAELAVIEQKRRRCDSEHSVTDRQPSVR